jgi:cystathionine beta-lyase
MEFETLVVQGIPPEENGFHAVTPPIYLTTTFAQKGLGEYGTYQYTRGANPTRANLEKLAAKLENAACAVAFATGMSASAAFFSLFRPGDKVLINSNIYGGTYAYVKRTFPRYGIQYELIDDLNRLEDRHLSADIKGIFIETPSNPLLRVTDIRKICALAHGHGILVGVDNTFSTPREQNCLALGADATIYSATKYLGGHADVTAGLITTNRADLAEEFRFEQIHQGAVLSPFDCYSLIRGIKTLSVRFEKQTKNTLEILAFLRDHPGVSALYYAGSYSEEERRIQSSQAGGIGAVLSFSLKDDYDVGVFLGALEIFTLAPSLGGVESLIEHVASMSHQAFSPGERHALGITDSLLRLAVGIESPVDLIEDLARAFERARKKN